MELELVEFLQGLFTLIFVVITFIIGLKIASKYFEYKRRVFVLIGLSWIGVISGWIPDAVTFLMIIFLDTPLSEEVYLIIALAFLPFSIYCFVLGFMDILEKKKEREKLYLTIFLIMGIVYEILFWYLFFSPTEAVGTFKGTFYVEFHPLLDIFYFIWIASALMIGLSFVRQSLQSKEPEVRLKGKLLLFAFITFLAGAFMELLTPLIPITVVTVRLILILSSILFYFGFLKGIEESEESEIESREEIHDAQDFLKMVSKHKHKPLTEEEITFYREQKICLVCKNKVAGLTYLCPTCDVLYCEKCYKVLSDLENYCWVCFTPFDYSKPVKIPKEMLKAKAPLKETRKNSHKKNINN